MGTDLFKGFGVDIAKELNDALGPGFPDATLVVRTLGAEDPTDLSGGRPITDTPHACKAILENFSQQRFQSGVIREGNRVVLILGDSLPSGVVPKSEDRVIAEGETLHLTGPVIRDPAGATYICEVRV